MKCCFMKVRSLQRKKGDYYKNKNNREREVGGIHIWTTDFASYNVDMFLSTSRHFSFLFCGNHTSLDHMGVWSNWRV